MTPAELKEAVQAVIRKEDADVYVYSADIQSGPVEHLRKLVWGKAKRRKKAILFLTTPGGDPDAGYRLAACLKRAYESFSVYVFGRCKSAGTLVVLGATSLVFGDFGELGPLDVQLAKRDEIMASNSGLDIFQAMAVLNSSAFECFEQSFLGLISKSGGNISAKMAAEIATQMAVGLFSPMTAQIDPERLGEVQRAVNIATQYGERLDVGNLKKQSLDTLVQGYPCHGFVIDCQEASKLFNRVREGSPIENAIADGVPGIRNRTEAAIVLDLETLIGSGSTKGVVNAPRPSPAKRAAVAPKRLRGSRNAASAERNAGIDAQTPKADPDPPRGSAGARSAKGRSGARSRLVRAKPNGGATPEA